jgi:nicotinamidase-related amidase
MNSTDVPLNVLLSESSTCLLVVDIQEKLFPFIQNKYKILDQVKKLIKFAKIVELPIIVTEQNPLGLGKTIRELKEFLTNESAVEKYTFSCCGEPTFNESLVAKEFKNIIVVGIETHICVTQTVLELISRGFNVHVIADAIGARGELDHKVGLKRMKKAGAVISTTEMVMYEYLKTSKHPKFKDFLKQIMK